LSSAWIAKQRLWVTWLQCDDISRFLVSQSLTFLKSHPSSHSSLISFLVEGDKVILDAITKESSSIEWVIYYPGIPWKTKIRSLTRTSSFISPVGLLNLKVFKYSSCFYLVDTVFCYCEDAIGELTSFISTSLWSFFL
jgi:hypothetical protein